MGKKYGVNELRKMFLDFFATKDHLIMESFSLVPHNDKSLLLINAGMAPLKPYFTGQEIPPSRRVATCQKCIRTGDIENVGKTARHGTFFEMLGNFSFGDYFKKEAIAWTWEFLTEVLGLPGDRIYPSVYLEDDEAFEIWQKDIGILPERIYRFGKEDNFWEHGAGPCGPCSEVYYDRGERFGCGRPDCGVGCGCDRYIEVWNNVFTQFDSDGQGHYTELENKNIDTGMGLERLAVVVQDVDSIFEIDTVRALLDEVARIAKTVYKKEESKDISLRLISDHIRSCTFMISDGIMPSNEGRGYVLRRLLRRAARHGRMLGIQEKFLSKLAQLVISLSCDAYPQLRERQDMIVKVLEEEEDKFYRTIDQGLSILAETEARMQEEGRGRMTGEEAFRLYDTYGFPPDLTGEILAEKGLSIDEEGFSAAMEKQRNAARAARKTTNYMGADVTVYESLDPSLTTAFTGYDRLLDRSAITALTTEEAIACALTEGERGSIICTASPFYAAMGGQEGDKGRIETEDALFIVEDVQKLRGDKQAHIGYMERGMLKEGDTVSLIVEEDRRASICKNHSATHLLHKALREILGLHVEQAGSLVSEDRLRFDFTHFSPLTKEEIHSVEELVNREIKASLPVHTDLMEVEEAKKSGAMALFGEKYKDEVRVVSMGDFSKELCGGTHVANTADISAFKIVSEFGVAAGVRRIEALTGEALQRYYESQSSRLMEIARSLKTAPADIEEKILSLLEEIKSLRAENESLKAKIANAAAQGAKQEKTEIKDIVLVTMSLQGVEINEMRRLGDELKEAEKNGVVLLASVIEGKVSLMATAAQEAMAKGVHAGNLIKAIAPLVGGSGGGRPNMAQAGGKDPSGIGACFEEARSFLEKTVRG